MALSLPPTVTTREQLAGAGYVVIRGLASEALAGSLRASTAGLPVFDVDCGIAGVRWREHRPSPGHPMYDLFAHGDLLTWVSANVGRALGASPVCWTSHYLAGQYINEHRDIAGAVQLLLCLDAPPEGCGGELRFGPRGKGGGIFLRRGDGVLFRAAHLLHATSPLTATAECTAPERMVAVARYFDADERRLSYDRLRLAVRRRVRSVQARLRSL